MSNKALQTIQLPAPLPLVGALVASSAISVALLAVRIAYSGSMFYQFLTWNLALAWTPFLFALALWWTSERAGYRVVSMGLLATWLLFFPNAPYIVTDLIHLRIRTGVPIWYDAALLFSFAWNGLILGFASLWLVQILVARRYGPVFGWLLVLVTLAAGGFGIYLGRFLRWNSWDVFADPWHLLNDVTHRLINPLDHPLTLAVTVLFAGLLTIMYVTLTALITTRWVEAPWRENQRI